MNVMFHGRSSAPCGRPLHVNEAAAKAQMERANAWTALAVSEPNAARRWASAAFPELAEGPARTAAERERLEALVAREELVCRRP